MSDTLLETWRNSATRRAEFAATLQEPCMQDAIAIIKEIIFTPMRVPSNLSPTERMACLGEMGLRREVYLEMLNNFLGLAKLEANKEKAKQLQKAKPWETADRKAGEDKLRSEFYGGHPPPLEGEPSPNGATASASEPVLPSSENPQPPQQ